MTDILLYTKPGCPYCDRAKALLREKSVEFQEIIASEKPEIRAEMARKSGGRNTFPQIFIGARHIGGCDDLFALDAAGELDALLGKG